MSFNNALKIDCSKLRHGYTLLKLLEAILQRATSAQLSRRLNISMCKASGSLSMDMLTHIAKDVSREKKMKNLLIGEVSNVYMLSNLKLMENSKGWDACKLRYLDALNVQLVQQRRRIL